MVKADTKKSTNPTYQDERHLQKTFGSESWGKTEKSSQNLQLASTLIFIGVDFGGELSK